MREFFHGWRRKAGCLALVMALILIGQWIRSRIVSDRMDVAWGGRQHAIISAGGSVYWWRDIAKADWFRVKVGYSPAEDVVMAQADYWRLERRHPERSVIPIPLLFLAIPLTLLSAYLILWKPRPKPV